MWAREPRTAIGEEWGGVSESHDISCLLTHQQSVWALCDRDSGGADHLRR